MLAILLLLPFALLRILGQPVARLASLSYKRRFGEVYAHTRRDQAYARGLFYPLFLLHRYFFLLVVFAGSFSGVLQAFLMILATSFFIHYVWRWRAFRSRFDLRLNLFSSMCLLLLYIFCFVFSVFNTSTLGLLFIGLVLFLFAANILAIVLHKLYVCHLSCKKRRARKRYLERLRKF